MFIRKIALLILIVLVSLASADDKKVSKAERIRRLQSVGLRKPSAFNDRKNGVMDNGRMIMYFSNSGCIDPYFNQTVQWPAGLRPVKNLVWQSGIMFGAKLPDGSIVTDESYCDPDVPTQDIFNPVPGYDNPNYTFPALKNPIVARSDILDSYPTRFGGKWPSADKLFDPLELRNLARQESFWIMRDDNEPENADIKVIGVEVKCWLIQINSSLTRDFIYAYYRLKNVSGQDLRSCRFGVLVDPDMPALVGAEFEDDSDGFERGLNLGYARDSDNFYASTPGVNIGHLGVKFLRSPKGADGLELGLRSWTTFEYGDMPGEGQFILAEDGPDETLGEYRNIDEAQYDYMRPGLYMKERVNTDVVFVMGSGDFNLAKGDSVDMAIAFIAAENFDRLKSKAIAAQRVFDNNFIGPNPPAAPAVTGVPGNESVTLYWNAEPSESSKDALTGRADFEGYRIYRSDDRGGSWGASTENEAKYPFGVLPIAEYDIVNTPGQLAASVVSHSNQVSLATIGSLGVADGSQPGDAANVDISSFFSNDDFHLIFDTDSTFQVLNASQGTLLKYLDDLAGAVGFAVLNDSFKLQLNNPDDTHGVYRSGSPIYLTGQFVRITDFKRDTTFSPVQAGDVFLVDQRLSESGTNAGLVHFYVDKNPPNATPETKQILNGYRYWYTVAAYDREDQVIGVTVNENAPLTDPNLSASDQTVEVIPQAPVAGYTLDVPTNAVFDHPNGLSHLKGFPLLVIDPKVVPEATYTLSFRETDEEKLWSLKRTSSRGDSAVFADQSFYDAPEGNATMFDGMALLQIQDLPPGVNEELSRQTALVNRDTLSFDLGDDYVFSETQAEKEYEIRFVSTPVNYPGPDSGSVVSAPFALFEITGNTSKQIGAVINDNPKDTLNVGKWSIRESFDLVNAAYAEPASFSYTDEDLVFTLKFELPRSDATGEVAAGNIFRIVGNRRLHQQDVYRFTTKSPRVQATAGDLAAVRVVPNPFVVTSVFDTDRDRHEIHFTSIPEACRIKIFTLAGDLVRTIQYDRSASGGQDFAKWDLKNEFGSEVAYGVYFYHLESPVGSRIGKIAIVR